MYLPQLTQQWPQVSQVVLIWPKWASDEIQPSVAMLVRLAAFKVSRSLQLQLAVTPVAESHACDRV